MTSTANSSNLQTEKKASLSRQATLEPVLHKFDVVAVAIVALGGGLVVLTAIALAVIGLIRLIPNLWAGTSNHWVLLIFALAAVWIAARRKHM